MNEPRGALAQDDELFDADFLQRLRTLFFKLKRRKQLKQKGVQQTHAAGFTREFKDHRPYTSRDDFRAIDWRLYARLEKLFIRLYEEIQEFHVHVLIDRSRSMVEPHGGKRVVALRLAVALSYLALMNQHRVSVYSFNDEVRQELRPVKGQGHIHAVLRQLAGLEFSGLTDLEASLKRFRPGRDRRGLVFIISDLFGQDPFASRDALHQAIRWPAETHVVHVLHPEEIEPRLDGEVQLIDVETGEARRLSLSPQDVTRYTAAVRAFLGELEQSCVQRRIHYTTWTTDAPFEQAFMGLLSRGSSLSQG
ncbi:MAG: DUF58 domain-containing protein [Planctomycetota bacterium]